MRFWLIYFFGVTDKLLSSHGVGLRGGRETLVLGWNGASSCGELQRKSPEVLITVRYDCHSWHGTMCFSLMGDKLANEYLSHFFR